MYKSSLHTKLGEFIRFGIVGIAATATHFFVLLSAVEVFSVSAIIANGFAFLLAVFVTYLGQALWVFRQDSKGGKKQILKFTISVVAGLIANVSIMAIVKNGLGLGYYIGFAASLATVPVMSFGINKFWVFREKSI